MFQVGLPDSDSGGQVSVSKTASTIVRNSNAVVVANYVNDSISPLKTVSIATTGLGYNMSPPPTAVDSKEIITGETYEVFHNCTHILRLTDLSFGAGDQIK